MSSVKIKSLIFITAVVIVLLVTVSEQVNLPGPLVYVVTPSSSPQNVQIDSVSNHGAYYYNSWRRNMDIQQSITTTTTTPRNRIKTPDLLFAEFGSDNGNDPNSTRKSIRQLLEKERIKSVTPNLTKTNSKHYSNQDKTIKSNEHIDTDSRIMSLPTFSAMYDPINTSENIKNKYNNVHYQNSDEDLRAIYNNLYEETIKNPITTTTAAPAILEANTLMPMKLEDIWHVINNEQNHENLGKWEQVPISIEPSSSSYATTVDENTQGDNDYTSTETIIGNAFGDDLAYPGFNSQENSSENESRAIRTESNLRFPYVNLKTYQMKNKPLLNAKKGNNFFTSVDKLKDEQYPVRGEAQDSVYPQRAPIDRYNPAQPYLPPSPYGSNKKQSASLQPASAPAPAPVKNVANLIPPPPPPPPRASPNDFPAPPDTYESFPPFAPPPSAPFKPPSRPISAYLPPQGPPADDFGSGPNMSDDNSSPPTSVIGGGYQYKPPSSENTVYDYKKPILPLAPPADDDDSGPPPSDDDKQHFTGYSYKKPHGAFQDHGPPEGHDYPELIYNKPHMPDPMKGGDMGNMVKGIEMMPPPPPADGGMDNMKPDFPNLNFDHHPHHDDAEGYKYHNQHDIDDYEHYHHHHHHHTTTTTTTTTEMPRVNRYSYYYLGKKLYYLPLYFSVYFVIYVAALIIKAVLRHKIVYPNSWKASKRSVDNVDLTGEKLHEVTRLVTNGLIKAAERYTKHKI